MSGALDGSWISTSHESTTGPGPESSPPQLAASADQGHEQQGDALHAATSSSARRIERPGDLDLVGVLSKRRRRIERLLAVEEPRDRRQSRGRDPRPAGEARRGDADEREREQASVHGLEVGAGLRRRHVQLEDQLARLECRHLAVIIRRKAVEVRERQLASVCQERSVKGEEGGGRIRGVRRRARRVRDDRVLSMHPLAGKAAVAAVEPAGVLEPPVPAARRLEEVAADRAHRADLGRRREPAGLAESVGDLRVGLELLESRPGADSRPVDPSWDDGADVHDRVRGDDPVAEHRHEVGPAGERNRSVVERRPCRLERIRP